MRFTNVSGNANQQLVARAKHVVVLDAAEDQGTKLKEAQPGLGWGDDVDGYPTLPWSVVARLVAPALTTPASEELLFAYYPTIAPFARAWAAIVPGVQLDSDAIYKAFMDAADKVDPAVLEITAAEWTKVQSTVDDHGVDLARWLPFIKRSDAFASSGKLPGLVAAELWYYGGPYMLTVHRSADSHFMAVAKILGKAFQSDEMVDLCEGQQLAAEVAQGVRDSAWRASFT